MCTSVYCEIGRQLSRSTHCSAQTSIAREFTFKTEGLFGKLKKKIARTFLSSIFL